jgi:IS30 family transposase
VSHETIYRSLFIQARGVLKKELLEHLRARRTVRRSRHASMKRNGLGQIKNAVSIRERPPSVEDRAVPGHWEGDLIGWTECIVSAPRFHVLGMHRIGGKIAASRPSRVVA